MSIFDAINAVKKIKVKDAPDIKDMETIIKKMSSIPGLRVEKYRYSVDNAYLISWKVKEQYSKSEVSKYEKRINDILKLFDRKYRFKNFISWPGEDIEGTIIVNHI